MARPGRQVPAVAGAQTAGAERRLRRRHLEVHQAGDDVDRLVLHAVVLVTERLALADVEDVACVALGPCPDRFVPPGLGDVLGARRAGGTHDRGAGLLSRSRPRYIRSWYSGYAPLLIASHHA